MKSISGLWHPSPTLRNALHSSSLSGAYNSGHTATLRSAQIAKATSYVRKTLGVIFSGSKHLFIFVDYDLI